MNATEYPDRTRIKQKAESPAFVFRINYVTSSIKKKEDNPNEREERLFSIFVSILKELYEILGKRDIPE